MQIEMKPAAQRPPPARKPLAYLEPKKEPSHVVDINFLLLGLANGAVYAALGLALVVTFRSSGVMNFSTSSIGLFSAYMYTSFRTGDFRFLIPGLPKAWHFADQVGFWPSAVLALAVTALFGLLVYIVIFRPLRNSPAVAKAVASLGLMVVLTGVMAQRQGTSPPAVSKIFPQNKLQLGSLSVSADRACFAATVIAIALLLWAIARFTRFGLLTRAAAASEKGAYVSGISPDRIAALNWMISAAVAGAAGILIAPIVPLVPVQYTLFIVPGLAAALLGGFELLLPAVLGGLVIGMVQSEVAFLQVQHTWLPSAGLSEAVPLVLILLVLVARARPLPARGVILRPTLSRAPRPKAIWTPAVGGMLVGAIALIAFTGTTRASLLTSLVFVLLALSYVVVAGYSGQISLAQLTLAGVAGFLLGPLTTTWRLPLIHAHVPFPLAPVVAASGAMIIGFVIAIPAVRIRGLSVAVVTLALAVVLEAGWFKNFDIVGSGGKVTTGPNLFGHDLTSGVGTAAYPRLGSCLTTLVVVVLVAMGVATLRRSRLGANMLAVRANERSAAAAGVNVVWTKIVAFAIGAFVAGLGGALLAYMQGVATYDSFDAFLGLSVFATAYLAGITSVSGAVVAGMITANGLVYVALDSWIGLGKWYGTIAGVGLILTVVRYPEGVVGPLHLLADRVRARRAAIGGFGAGTIPIGGRSELALSQRSIGVDRTKTRPSAPALAVRGVTVRYGGVTAVNDVAFDVPYGRIVGLIGPNGAGKTTLIDAISGFAPAAGAVELGGQSITSLTPHQRARAGLGRTFQAIELYEDLSVSENVIVGQAATRGKATEDQLLRVLALLGLYAVAEKPAGELSQGTRQLVSIARALVGEPDVLLLDEPAGGLDSTESQWLGRKLRDISDTGVSVVLIDHDMHLVLDLCDEIQVLNFGEIIAAGTPAVVRAHPAVRSAYLGSTHEAHHHGAQAEEVAAAIAGEGV
jgi:ABC-type branched-subunit amino acid transport system ATPase component/branched-subunit amino acid ABC-type transport system permease component